MECSVCPLRSRYISEAAKYRMVERAYFKWASEEQHMKNDGTPGYYEALRLRKTYCEGNFSHQKTEHNLRRLRKRGLGKAHEHCLLSATALNLKRMVKILTHQKHPSVSLHKTLNAIGRSSKLYPMALLSTGPGRGGPCRCPVRAADASPLPSAQNRKCAGFRQSSPGWWTWAERSARPAPQSAG